MLSRRSLSKARTPMDPPPPYPPWLLSFPSIVALKACTVVIHDLNETAHDNQVHERKQNEEGRAPGRRWCSPRRLSTLQVGKTHCTEKSLPMSEDRDKTSGGLKAELFGPRQVRAGRTLRHLSRITDGCIAQKNPSRGFEVQIIGRDCLRTLVLCAEGCSQKAQPMSPANTHRGKLSHGKTSRCRH